MPAQQLALCGCSHRSRRHSSPSSPASRRAAPQAGFAVQQPPGNSERRPLSSPRPARPRPEGFRATGKDPRPAQRLAPAPEAEPREGRGEARTAEGGGKAGRKDWRREARPWRPAGLREGLVVYQNKEQDHGSLTRRGKGPIQNLILLLWRKQQKI